MDERLYLILYLFGFSDEKLVISKKYSLVFINKGIF